MPDEGLLQVFQDTARRYDAVANDLAGLAERLALETVAGALPATRTLELRGELNEGWLRTLRIQRVLDASGRVLFDATEGHDDRSVEDAIDETDADYLDLLLDLTGDRHMGLTTLEREPPTPDRGESARGASRLRSSRKPSTMDRGALTPEQLERQHALDRSWAQAQRDLADPAFRAELEASIERLNRSTAQPISGSEFLAQTERAGE